MAGEWNLLQLETRVRVKGDKDIDGTITDWRTDDKDGEKVIVGYRVTPDNDPSSWIDLTFDHDVEVLGV